MKPMRGVHINLLTGEAEEFLLRARPAIVKTLDHSPDWASIRTRAGIRFLLGRVWLDEQADFAPGPEAAAERLFNTMLPVMERWRGIYDAWETPWNERAQRGPEALGRHARACRRFCELARAAGFRVAVGNFSVGNPEPEEFAAFFGPGLELADFLSLHEYWLPGNLNAPFWAHRWRRLLEALPAELRRPVIITECGIDGGLEGKAGAGWRAYGLSPAGYARELEAYYSGLDQRVLGITVFNLGDYPGGMWGSFELAGAPELEAFFSAPEAADPTAPATPFAGWVAAGGSGRLTDYLAHVRAIGGDPTPQAALADGWRPPEGWLLAVDSSAPAMGRAWTVGDFEALKALGVELVIIGVFHYLEGRAVWNQWAKESLEAARRVGLMVGTYWGIGPGLIPQVVVRATRSLLGEELWSALRVAAVDAEVEGLRPEEVGAWLKAVAGQGQAPWLYTSPGFYARLGRVEAPPGARLWLASWGREPGDPGPTLPGWPDPDGHQFTGTTRLAGLAVDLNVFSRRALMEAGKESAGSEIRIQLDAAWGHLEALKAVQDLPLRRVADEVLARAGAAQAALAVIATRLREQGILKEES